MKELTVTLRLYLDEEEQEKLAEYAALRRQYDVVCFPGRQYSEWRYTNEESLRHILSVAFLDDVLNEAIDKEKRLLEHRQKIGPVPLGSKLDEEAGDVPTRNPSPEAKPDEAEKKPKAVSNEAAFDDDEKAWLFDNHCVDCAFHSPDHECCDDTKWFCYWSVTRSDDHALGEVEPETVPNAEEEVPGDRESEPDGEEDFLSLTPLPCSYPHDPTVQYTPYDPVRYEGDAYECGGCVVENPETLAFVDALTEALCR